MSCYSLDETVLIFALGYFLSQKGINNKSEKL